MQKWFRLLAIITSFIIAICPNSSDDNICGQIAITDYLKHKGYSSELDKITAQHPPDVLFGKFGTSKRQIKKALSNYNIHLKEYDINQLQENLDNNKMCIIMISYFKGDGIPTGHWTVAYGYKNEIIYFLDGSRLHINELNELSRGLVSILGGMGGVVLCEK